MKTVFTKAKDGPIPSQKIDKLLHLRYIFRGKGFRGVEFKDELKRFRKAHNLTQMELSHRLGVAFTTINRLEKGRFKPSYGFLSKFHEFQEEIQKEILPEEIPQKDVFSEVSKLIEESGLCAYRFANEALLKRNWLIGKRIHEEGLKSKGKENPELGIITALSKELNQRCGSKCNAKDLYRFLSFYEAYPNIFQTPSAKSFPLSCGTNPKIVQTLSAQSFLSWSHYLILLQVDDEKAREWYEKEAVEQSWSVRTLQRNVSTQYYFRLLNSQRKDLMEKEMLSISRGSSEDRSLEFIKNPTILEFLNIPENNEYVEKDLEKCLIQNIKKFLMELGKGYAFVTSQKRISTEKQEYFIDLVFYNYILKCFVLIDLKTGKLSHQDVGQMDMYVQMYDERERQPDDNPTIGILLCPDTDEDVARYSSLHLSNQLYASKYKIYLPSEEELKKEIARQKAFFYLQQADKDE